MRTLLNLTECAFSFGLPYIQTDNHAYKNIYQQRLSGNVSTLRNRKNANLPTEKLPICLCSSFLPAAAAASSTASVALAPGFAVSVGVAVSYVPVGVGDGFGAV